jgi:hypothetical protein
MGILWGNGDVETEERFEKGFDSVGVSGTCCVRLHRGDYKIVARGDSNILPRLVTRVSGNELLIGLRPFDFILRKTALELDVTLPDLSALECSGSSEILIDDFSGDDLSLSLSGSGGLRADGLDYESIAFGSSGSARVKTIVQAKDLSLRCSGSGSIEIMGSAIRAEISVSGSADIDAANFAAQEARIRSSGSSRIGIRAVRTLDAQISGSGEIDYWGEPSLSRRVSGSGRIERAGD